jgi:pimeloyl-ACP methyl ester carboxylesterase
VPPRWLRPGPSARAPCYHRARVTAPSNNPVAVRGGRALRWVKRIALLAVAGVLLFVFGWAPWWLAGVATTRSYRYDDKENAGLTPASFHLAFEDVAFRASDGVELKAWWVPAQPARGTVVLVHGLNRSRIEMVKKTEFLHALGWNALLLDLRHHGASGGTVSSFGWFERLDVRAAREWAQQRSPGPVVLWGVSLGGATVMLEAADDPGVSGVVCDSTYRSLPDTIRHHLHLVASHTWWLRPLPEGLLASEVLFWTRRRGGFEPANVDVAQAAAKLSGRPCLFVCNSGDVRMPSDIAFELRDAVGGTAKVLVVPGKSHGGAWRDGTPAYQAAVTELLQTVLGQRQAQGRGEGNERMRSHS